MTIELIIGGTLVAVGLALAAVIRLRRQNRRLIDILQTLLPSNERGEVEYVPEHCDIRMAEDCRELVRLEFPNGIEATLSKMGLEERKQQFERFIAKASERMRVTPPAVKFSDSVSYSGEYDFGNDELTLSQVYIANDADLSDCINTVFHELKHKVQFMATRPEGNVWGYSNHLVAIWKTNIRKYIRPDIDPLGYSFQSVEHDARSFADSIIKKAIK